MNVDIGWIEKFFAVNERERLNDGGSTRNAGKIDERASCKDAFFFLCVFFFFKNFFFKF